MPFQSEKQRKYLWANEPAIAKRWEKYPKGYNTGGVSHLFRSKEPAQGGYIRPEDSGVLGLADGGKIIKGQEHTLAYITPGEAQSLQDLGGKKVMTPEGIPAYPGHFGREIDTSRSTPSDDKDPNRPQGMPEHLTYTAPVQTVTRDYGGGDGFQGEEKYVPTYSEQYDILTKTKDKDDKDDIDARSKYLATMYDKPLTAKQKERQKKKIYDKWEKKDTLLQKGKDVGSFLYDAYKTKSGPLWTFGGPIPAMIKFALDQNKKKKALIKDIKTDIKKLTNLGATKYSPHTDTLLQKLEQKLLDLTQVRKRKDEERDKDIPQGYATVEDPYDPYDMSQLKASMEAMRILYERQRVESPIVPDTSKRDAYLAAYRQKYLMGAQGGRVPSGYNTGGLSNLFRLKNT